MPTFTMRTLVNWVAVAIIPILLAWALPGVGSVARAAAVSEPVASAAESIASPEPGWPQWRGPRRDGVCDETGLRQSWPNEGPRLLWKTTGLGQGYSCPIISSNRIYITGDEDDRLSLFALDLEGRQVWKSQNGQSWRGPYPGARACFAYRHGRLFHMNAHGRVACVDPQAGTELWSVDVSRRFEAKKNTWAFSECLLVDDRRVIVTPGGPKAFMAALDIHTGETIWTTDPIRLGPADSPAQLRLAEPVGEVDSAGYASPILVQSGAARMIIGCSLRHAVAVDARSGRLLWTRPMPTSYSVIAATPVLADNAVFFTAPDLKTGGFLLEFAPQDPARMTQRWTTLLDTCQGGLVYRQGSLYGSRYRGAKGWVCLDGRTGKTKYELPSMATGPVLWADGGLYWLSQEGDVRLLRPGEQGFIEAGRFRLASDRKNDVWTHPVICNRRLFLRDHDSLYCYDVAAR